MTAVSGTMSILAAKRINPLGPAGSRLLLWIRAAAGFGFMSCLASTVAWTCGETDLRLRGGYYYAIQHLPQIAQTDASPSLWCSVSKSVAVERSLKRSQTFFKISKLRFRSCQNFPKVSLGQCPSSTSFEGSAMQWSSPTPVR